MEFEGEMAEKDNGVDMDVAGNEMKMRQEE